jgi:hypothetical protein
MVFFDQHSDVVRPRFDPIISEFVNSLSDYADLTISLVASTDTSEVLPRDRTLDQRRGQSVERVMRENGIATDAKIRIMPKGAKNLLVPTPPLTVEPQDRVVWLAFEGGRQIRPTAWQADCMAWLRTHRCDPQMSAAQAAICNQVDKVAHEFTP